VNPDQKRLGTTGVFCLIFLFFTLLICGCFTMDTQVRVGADGLVQDYQVGITMNQYVYGMMMSGVEQNGQTSLREAFSDEYGAKENLFSYEEEWTGDDVTITVTSKAPFSVDDKEKLTIRREGNYLIYEDSLFVSEEQSAYSDNPMANAMYSGMGSHYYLEMPGKIIESNANVVEGNKAEWHITGPAVFSTAYYAKSEVPAFVVPNLVWLVGLIVLILLAVWLPARRRERYW